MSDFAEVKAGGRRLMILRFLHDDEDYTVNSSTMRLLLKGERERVSLATVRADYDWLADRDLVTVETLGSDVVVATLTDLGVDVSQGHATVDGVARLRPHHLR